MTSELETLRTENKELREKCQQMQTQLTDPDRTFFGCTDWIYHLELNYLENLKSSGCAAHSKTVMEILDTLLAKEKRNKHISFSALVNAVKERGLDAIQARDAVELLKRNGRIFEIRLSRIYKMED